MYIPEHFAEHDAAEQQRFIRSHSFGQLVSLVENRLFVTHLPFLLSEHGTHLMAHLAYGNPQWEQMENQEVLVTFQGQHGYVSPSLYSSPGVPTWNYQVVHVYGRATVFQDADEKHALLEALTRNSEAGRPEPWQPVYPAARLKGIVGVEIEITEMQGKYKLSQNLPQDDQQAVAGDMLTQGLAELARAMSSGKS